MLRKQAYFAGISFIILCVAISIAHFVFGLSILPIDQPLSPLSPTTNIKPSFLFDLFLLVVSLVMLIGGVYFSYFVWFQGDKVRENLEHTRELAQQGKVISLRHDYSRINITAYLWFMRFFSPMIVFLGLVLFLVTLNDFQEVVFICC